MNLDDNDFIQRHLSGTLSEDESALLREALKSDPALRLQYLDYMNLDAALAARAESDAATRELLGSTAAPTPSRWFQWRPLTAAAAGVMVGLFSASLVWAVASPWAPALRSHAITIVDGDFEDSSPLSTAGVPVECGAWSGDFAEIASAQKHITPQHGQHMLHFLRSDSESATGPQLTRTGNIYQAVDMRPYRAKLADGQARLDWSAWFQWDPPAASGAMTFAMNVWTFTGSPSILPSNWRDHLYRETAKSGSRKSFDDLPGEWGQLKGSMIVPSDTDFLVIELKAIPPEEPDHSEPYRFVGCYVDNVQLILTSKASVPATAQTNHPQPSD